MKAKRRGTTSFGILILFLFEACFFAGCGQVAGSGDSADSEISYVSVPVNPFENSSTYFSTSREIRVDVFFEPGAEPYINSSNTTQTPTTNLWSIAAENITALFQNRSVMPSIIVPRSLSEMSNIGSQNKSNWTTEEVYNLGIRARRALSSQTSTNIVVLFLRGNYNGGATTLGVTIQGQTIVAIFKDAIRTGNSTLLALQLLEQRTVIHELAHVMGLVNLGVYPSSPTHEDPSHLHHCSNVDCVMYYAGDARSDLTQFIERVLTHGDHIMFGTECLSATQNFRP